MLYSGKCIVEWDRINCFKGESVEDFRSVCIEAEQ